MTKSKAKRPTVRIARMLRAIGSQPRLEILLAIGAGQACVCHLEALLGWRQAYISQHLMALRQAGILDTRREGKYIFYRLQDPALLQVLAAMASIAGVALPEPTRADAQTPCGCPTCSPELVGDLAVSGGVDA